VEKQKSYLGYWWIPIDGNHPSNEDMVVGSISIGSNNRVELELLGTFSQNTDSPLSFLGNNYSTPVFSVIHGTIKDNDLNCITLLNCRQISHSLSGNGVVSTKYTANFVLCHFQKHCAPDALAFRKIKLGYTLLFDWLGRTAIGYDDNFNIQKRIPPSINVNVNEAMISINNDIINSHSHKKVAHQQTAWIRIENSQPLSINKWFDLFITPLRHFFTVATDVENKLTELSIYPLHCEENDCTW
jgi:ApeA N-terminal domain 1